MSRAQQKWDALMVKRADAIQMERLNIKRETLLEPLEEQRAAGSALENQREEAIQMERLNIKRETLLNPLMEQTRSAEAIQMERQLKVKRETLTTLGTSETSASHTNPERPDGTP